MAIEPRTHVECDPRMNQLRSRRTAIAIGVLVGVNALWGLSFPMMKGISQIIENHFQIRSDAMSTSLSVSASSGMIAIRFLFAMAILCMLFPRLVRGATRLEWVAGFWIGLLFSIGLVLQVVGLSTIPASRSGFLTSLTAVYTPLIASFLSKKAPNANVIVGAVLALLGIAVLSDLFPNPFFRPDFSRQEQQMIPLNWGDLWTTLGALFFSFQVLLIDHFGKTLRSSAFTPGMFVTAAVVSAIIFAVAQSMTSMEYGSIGLMNWLTLFSMPGFMGIVLFLAIFCSLLAFLGMNTYQPSISAAQASVIYSLEPVFASVWAMLVPGILAGFLSLEYQNESLTVHLMVGGLLILVANIVALWPRSECGASTP